MDPKLRKALFTKDVSMLERFTINGRYNLHDDKFLATQLHKNKWSLLNVVEIGNPELTKLFLNFNNSIDINDNESHGRTALHQAVYDLYVSHVNLLLNHNADPNILDTDSRTPIYYLYYNQKSSLKHDKALEIMKALLNRGAKAITTKNNINQLQIKDTLENGNVKVVETVLNMTSIDDLTIQYDDDEYTVLHHLARNSNSDVLQVALRDRKFEVDARNSFQQTPLWCAARAGVPNAVEFLLRKGADVDAEDKKNDTPICIAIMRFNDRDTRRKSLYIECIMILLEHGANVQMVYEDDETIFDLIVEIRDESLCEILLEYLALKEASGNEINRVVRSKIDSKTRFKKHFEACKQVVVTEVYPSKTLCKLLSCREEKFVPYMRNEELVEKLNSYCDHLKSIKSVYYYPVLQKRLKKASEIAKLRDSATVVLRKLTKIDNSFILDIIISYLDYQDLSTLESLQC